MGTTPFLPVTGLAWFNPEEEGELAARKGLTWANVLKVFMVVISSLVQCLRVRTEVYPRVKHLKGSSLGLALALPANIRLGLTG